jgi:hypothetical protein
MKFAGSLRLYDSFMNRLRDKGFTAQDIPKAIIIHEVFGVLMLALTWSLCYCYPLSETALLKQPIGSIMSKMPNILSRSIESNKFLTSRLGVSYIESSCLRKLIRPITLPVKLILTLKLVESLPPLPDLKLSLPENCVKNIAPVKVDTISPNDDVINRKRNHVVCITRDVDISKLFSSSSLI